MTNLRLNAPGQFAELSPRLLDLLLRIIQFGTAHHRCGAR